MLSRSRIALLASRNLLRPIQQTTCIRPHSRCRLHICVLSSNPPLSNGRFHLQQRFLTTSSSSSSTDTPAAVVSDDKTAESVILYESPLGSVVTRLRAVSLFSALLGSVGLPVFLAMRGGDLPSTGMLAMAMTFVAGSLGSTAAIHFVFHPYVYILESIPIRKCSTKKDRDDSTESSIEPGITQPQQHQQQQQPLIQKDHLYKAVSRSVFLTRIETVFDVGDVVPYKGLRPLCNFVVKKGNKSTPLYVHPEYVFHPILRKTLHLKELESLQNNPDEFL